MTAPLAQFDRDITLAELLRAIPARKLESMLARTVGNSWQILDAGGTPLLGPGTGTAEDILTRPLRVDIETIGQLAVANAQREQLELAATWLDMLLAGANRYLMAADLHLEAIHADYEALQRKHAALQESESRYRELSAQLELRVKTQVDIIERTQRHLYQAEKMASVGSLAAGMAHEINNPIGFIRSNFTTAAAYVQKMRAVLDAFQRDDAAGARALWSKFDIDFILEDFPGMLAESASGADRIARIVANLKAYASIDIADAVPINLNDAVHAVADIVGDRLPQGVTLELDVQPLPNMQCDAGRINQVLFALVENARQAIEGDGRIRIASRLAGGEIRVAVSDSGRGIAPEVLNRIFDPFFTTHDVGKGMGLGLTVSRDIVSAYQGRIEVVTAAGAGSTFTVCLPVASDAQCINPAEKSL
jgi:two-component system NtrC family sensor kinase